MSIFVANGHQRASHLSHSLSLSLPFSIALSRSLYVCVCNTHLYVYIIPDSTPFPFRPPPSARRARPGGILTSFPMTAAQAELLGEQGVDIQQLLVLVARAGADGAGDRSSVDDDDDKEEKEEEEEDEEKGRQLLTERLAGRVVKLAGQRDVDSLCDSAASLLALGKRKQRSSGDAVVVGGSGGSGGAPPSAAVRASEPSPMLCDADVTMVGSLKIATHGWWCLLSPGSRRPYALRRSLESDGYAPARFYCSCVLNQPLFRGWVFYLSFPCITVLKPVNAQSLCAGRLHYSRCNMVP